MSKIESIAADSSDCGTESIESDPSITKDRQESPDSSSATRNTIDTETSNTTIRVGVIRLASGSSLIDSESSIDSLKSDPSSSADTLSRIAASRIVDPLAVPPRIDLILGPQLQQGFLRRFPVRDPEFKIPPSPTVSSTTSPGILVQQHSPSPRNKSKTPGSSSRASGSSSRIRKSTAAARNEEEEPSSSIPEIEFDGTTVLCRVCGDKASGFHYGVHSCEGCKGFFRRSIQQKIQYRPCTKNQQCSILRINRNRCQYCRLKKCIAVGMSRDAVRFGRVPKREKAKILAAMQSVNAKSAERALTAELSDETQVMNAVIRAHMETCDFTRDKVDALMSNATRQPDYIACPPTLACPLNPTPAQINGQQQLLQDFSERFSPAIRGVVEFAKRLPGFALLAQDDQVTLLKAGVFEVLLVRLAAMFDSSSNTMLCLNGQLLRRDTLHNSSNARFLMDSMFEFAERLNSLGLNDSELALFCAVVVIAADRPGLRNNDLVERMQSKLRTILEGVLHQSHPEKQGLFAELLRTIPDLRTLNTLHSEKLLAFKMTEQQQQQQQQQQIQMHLPGLHPQSFIHQTPSPWADRYDDDGTKSPVGSVSSSESVYSSEAGMSDLPLLAAVAGSAVPLSAGHRKIRTAHSEHGSTSSDGEETDVTIRILESPPKTCPFTLRKLDSPDDSGIESGMDRYEKLSTTSRSTTTSSICSSPRSSLDDKVKEVEESTMLPAPMSLTRSCPRPGGVDDMPVLKRVLQAPPLFDTNSLMDEAYRQHPHKKFRAHRRDCSDEAKVSIQDSPQSPPTSVLAAALSAPPATSSFAAVSSALTSTHSTLARTLMEAPKLSSEQQRRADLIVTNIMKGTTSAYAAAPGSPSTCYAYRPHHGRIGSPASLPALSPVHNGSPVSSPRLQSVVELQVGISDSQPQPLNLSLKSPASSPDRPTSPVTHAHYFPLHV